MPSIEELKGCTDPELIQQARKNITKQEPIAKLLHETYIDYLEYRSFPETWNLNTHTEIFFRGMQLINDALQIYQEMAYRDIKDSDRVNLRDSFIKPTGSLSNSLPYIFYTFFSRYDYKVTTVEELVQMYATFARIALITDNGTVPRLDRLTHWNTPWVDDIYALVYEKDLDPKKQEAIEILKNSDQYADLLRVVEKYRFRRMADVEFDITGLPFLIDSGPDEITSLIKKKLTELQNSTGLEFETLYLEMTEEKLTRCSQRDKEHYFGQVLNFGRSITEYPLLASSFSAFVLAYLRGLKGEKESIINQAFSLIYDPQPATLTSRLQTLGEIITYLLLPANVNRTKEGEIELLRKLHETLSK